MNGVASKARYRPLATASRRSWSSLAVQDRRSLQSMVGMMRVSGGVVLGRRPGGGFKQSRDGRQPVLFLEGPWLVAGIGRWALNWLSHRSGSASAIRDEIWKVRSQCLCMFRWTMPFSPKGAASSVGNHILIPPFPRNFSISVFPPDFHIQPSRGPRHQN